MKQNFLLIILLALLGFNTNAQENSDPSYLKVSQKLELRGLIHIRYQLFEDPGRIDGFDLRRARLDFRGDVAPKFGYRLHAELAGTPKILDAVFIYKPYEYFNVNIGQSKPTFCYDNLYSPWTLLTVNRTQIDNALAFRESDLYGNQNGRDLGIWVSGKLNTGKDDAKRAVLDYTLGLYNGAGINVADNNKEKDISGSLGISPVKDLWLHGRFYKGHGRTTSDPLVITERARFGASASYKYKNWLLEGEYLQGTDESDSLGQLERNGFYVTLGYTPVKDKIQLLLRLDNYDPNSKPENIDHAITKYILAANWYFTKNTRIQFEYNLVREEGDQIENDLLAIQFQAGF